MVDTNYFPPYSYHREWLKCYFVVWFSSNIIPRGEIYEDNRLIYYTIDDILPKYEKTIQDFRKLEEKWGKFRFVDMLTSYPDTTVYIEDKQAKSDRCLYIEFDSYIPSYSWMSDLYSYDTNYHNKVGKDSTLYADIENMEFTHHLNLISGLSGSFFALGSISSKTDFLYLEIYPNIASEQITLYLPEALIMLPKVIRIVNTTGSVVKLFYTGIDAQQTVNVSNLPSGHYFVLIDNYVGSFIVR